MNKEKKHGGEKEPHKFSARIYKFSAHLCAMPWSRAGQRRQSCITRHGGAAIEIQGSAACASPGSHGSYLRYSEALPSPWFMVDATVPQDRVHRCGDPGYCLISCDFSFSQQGGIAPLGNRRVVIYSTDVITRS